MVSDSTSTTIQLSVCLPYFLTPVNAGSSRDLKRVAAVAEHAAMEVDAGNQALYPEASSSLERMADDMAVDEQHGELEFCM